MRKKKAFFIVIILLCLFSAGCILLLYSPFFIPFVNLISKNTTDYSVHAKSFSFSSGFKTEVIELAIANTKDNSLVFTSAAVNIESKTPKAFKGEVERIILKEPKIRIRLGDKKKTETDLSFINNIPPVDLLAVEKGEFKLVFTSSAQEITLKDINMTIKNFSPRTGGMLTFQGVIDIIHPDKSKPNAHGICKGEVQLTGLMPRLIGKGLLEINLDSGNAKVISLKDGSMQMALTFEKDRIRVSKLDLDTSLLTLQKAGKRSEIRNASLKTAFIYDLKSKTISTETFLGEIPKLGAFRGTCSGKLTGMMPWKAQVEASQIDFSNLYTTLNPLFAGEEGNKWSFQGKGSLKTDMEGTLSGEKPTVNGKAAFQFQQGGFNSQDGSKAAQGVEGSMILKFSIPSREKKIDATLSSELSGGEYLWGRYYRDFTKEATKLSASADFSLDNKNETRLSGTIDLFNTGTYRYSGFHNDNSWGISIDAREVVVQRLTSLFFYDYLTAIAPFFKGLETEGTFNAAVTTSSHTKENLSLKGMIKLDDAGIKVPDKSLQITGVNISLPFDLTSADREKTEPAGEKEEKGLIDIGSIEKGTLHFSRIKIPVLLAGKRGVIPETIALPFYSGHISIMDMRVDDILVSGRKLSFMTKIENVDLAALLNELAGIEYPGSIEARFPLVTYQGNRLGTEGKASVKVFGGEIEAENIYAEYIFSSSRKIGGDALFRNIDLGKMTDTIKVGKITGALEGTVKNLVIEYGQPSQFVFEINTMEESDVPKKVSVDAIENISILGTGSGGVGSVLQSGVNRFFKEYPYSRIGIMCSLENDHFRIRGTIHEGGNEYLIRRGFLRGIDVVNKDPDNVVSFKDMQERIGRVFEERNKEKGNTVIVN